MEGEKIYLSEIISQVVDKNYKSKYNNICMDAMMEFGKQLLEIAAENAELVFVGESDSDGMDIDKQSILDTINCVEIKKK